MDLIKITPKFTVKRVLSKNNNEILKDGDNIIGKTISIKKFQNKIGEALSENGFELISFIKKDQFIVKNRNGSILRINIKI